MDNDILTQASAAAHRGERLSRERDAYLYLCAWDRDDFSTLCTIWERALVDDELEKILSEIDDELRKEMNDDIASEVNEEENKRIQKKIQHLLNQYTEEV